MSLISELIDKYGWASSRLNKSRWLVFIQLSELGAPKYFNTVELAQRLGFTSQNYCFHLKELDRKGFIKRQSTGCLGTYLEWVAQSAEEVDRHWRGVA